MRELSPIAQSIVDHIGELATEHDMNGPEIRLICAVVFAVYCKASGLGLDEAKDGLERMWNNSKFLVPSGGES